LLQNKDDKTPVLFRKLENQDISIPANVCFVVKKIEHFNAKECIASVALTTIMRIKCTNMINRDSVMNFLESKLRGKINDEEFLIADKCFKI